MKKIFTLFLLWFLFIWSSIEAFADTHVKWYYRKNWTYVKPHYRSDRNNTKADNWSTKGNINPYTWKAWTVNIYSSDYTSDTPSYNINYNSYSPNYSPSYSNYNSYSNHNSSSYNKKSCNDLYWTMSLDNLDWTCSCVSGYTFWKDNKCILIRDYCIENFWNWATYNYIMNKCECSSWYEAINNKCVRTTENIDNQNMNTTTVERPMIAIWIMNFDTNLRKTPWIKGEKIRIVRKWEYVYFSKEKSVKIWNHYWTTVMTWNKEVGYMITDTIDFVQDYAE